MFETQQQRHLIMAGILLVVLAGALWFSAWRQAGMSLPPRIEHILPLGAFGFGLFVLAFCLTRLPPMSLERALKVLQPVGGPGRHPQPAPLSGLLRPRAPRSG